jgi:hypothetical protein
VDGCGRLGEAMSIDLQVVFPQQVVHLSQARTVGGLVPRTFEVVGEDFSAVDTVLLNEIPSPDVVILSKTKLLAQVPDALTHQVVTSISVLSRVLTLSAKSFIRFRIGSTPGKIRGVLRLVQLFLKILFTTPGTDIFSPSTGGAGLASIGKTFGKDQGGSIISSFIISVDTTKRQIISIQARDPSLPRDERLLDARVTSAGFNKNEGALLVEVELTSQAGRSAIARVEL